MQYRIFESECENIALISSKPLIGFLFNFQGWIQQSIETSASIFIEFTTATIEFADIGKESIVIGEASGNGG